MTNACASSSVYGDGTKGMKRGISGSTQAAAIASASSARGSRRTSLGVRSSIPADGTVAPVSPLQNRVTPLGELVAVPERGLLYGNRGVLHDADGRIRRRYQGRRWIACRLEFRGRRRHPLLQPGRYTELFFLDEATALAAGHRPCAECRRADYDRFVALWRALHPGEERADAIDARLHAERLDGRGPRTSRAAVAALRDGAMVLRDGRPRLVLGDEL